jgi:hypothetical protein
MRGLLFTFATVFILFGFFLLTTIYFERTAEIRKAATAVSVGDRFAYMEDDIASGIYTDMLLFKLSNITRESDYIDVVFRPGGNLSHMISHLRLMAYHRVFVEQAYAAKNNVFIKLNNFSSYFRIMPFNSVYELMTANLTVFPGNPSAVRKMKAKLRLDFSHPLNVTTNASSLGTGTEIEIEVEDPDGDQAVYFRGFLDPTQSTLVVFINFTAPFARNKSMSVYYEPWEGEDGVLRVHTQRAMDIDIEEFLIRYDETDDKVYLKGGEIVINSTLEGFSRKSDIIIMEE